MNFLLEHHDLAVGLKYLLLFLIKLLSSQFLLMLYFRHQLVQLRLRHISELRVEIVAEKVIYVVVL